MFPLATAGRPKQPKKHWDRCTSNQLCHFIDAFLIIPLWGRISEEGVLVPNECFFRCQICLAYTPGFLDDLLSLITTYRYSGKILGTAVPNKASGFRISSLNVYETLFLVIIHKMYATQKEKGKKKKKVLVNEYGLSLLKWKKYIHKQ